jgi:hypothetical protein
LVIDNTGTALNGIVQTPLPWVVAMSVPLELSSTSMTWTLGRLVPIFAQAVEDPFKEEAVNTPASLATMSPVAPSETTEFVATSAGRFPVTSVQLGEVLSPAPTRTSGLCPDLYCGNVVASET